MNDRRTDGEALLPGTTGIVRVDGQMTGLVEDPDGLAAYTPANQGSGSASLTRGLLRQKWSLLAIMLIVGAAVVPLIWLYTVPLYESTALVRVEPIVPKIVYSIESNGMLPLYREYMNTQVNTIRSPIVFDRVLDRKEVQETHWCREEGKRTLQAPLTPMERLIKDLSVQTRRDTQLIAVTISTQKPSEAKLIVDAVVDEYYKLMQDRERVAYLELIGKVKAQHDELKDTINGLRNSRRFLSVDSGLMDSLELRNQVTTKLNALESQTMDVDRGLKLLQSRLERSSGTATRPVDSAPAVGEEELHLARDGEWRRLKLDLENAKHELELARQQYGESHPRIQLLASNIAHAESLLNERHNQLEADGPRAVAVTTGPALAATAAEPIEVILPEKKLEKQLLEENIKQLRKKVADITAIAENEEQLKEKQQVFEAVRARLTSLETELNAPGRISVESHGLKASDPDRDRRPLLTAMALAGAAMIALTIGYLRTASDPHIHAMGDIQQMDRVPFLGRLPLLSKTLVPRELGGLADVALLVPGDVDWDRLAMSYSDPGGPTALLEAVRMVRTAMLQRLAGRPTERVILITSPTTEAGKTSLALLLARSLAVTGKKILLVEGDFYRPSLSCRLGVQADSGLASLLAKVADDARAVQRTSLPCLDLLPVGPVHEGFSPEVLANGVFADCIARWRRSYDFVILDSPPVLPVADARIMAAHADGTLLVVRAAHTRRAEALTAYAQLADTRGGVLGVVMIGGEAEGGYGHYGYGGYGAKQEPGSSASVDAVAAPDASHSAS